MDAQLSFFSPHMVAPQVADLGGLLAAHGQIVRGAAGSRLSIVLSEPWRGEALLAEFDRRDVPATLDAGAGRAGPGGILLRSGRTPLLNSLAAGWMKGSAKDVPEWPEPPAGLIRCWALAAGHADESGYLLGLDPHAGRTYPDLAAALSAAGLTGSLIGGRGGGPAVRIVGLRRMRRLAEVLGERPDGAPADWLPTA